MVTLNTRRSAGLRRGVLLGLGLVLCACTVPVRQQQHAATRPITRLALVQITPDSSFETRVGRERALHAAALITARLLEQLGDRARLQVIPPEEVARALAAPTRATPQVIGRALQAKFGIDAYLTGTVERFRARAGSPEGVVAPAAVRFRLRLHAADGSLLWSGMYDEEQKSLSSDVRSLARARERGFRWVSAERLASYGAAQLVARMPGVD